MYFRKSDTPILWMIFCLEQAEKQYSLENVWSLRRVHAIILWAEQGVFTEYRISESLLDSTSLFSTSGKRYNFGFGPETLYTSRKNMLNEIKININLQTMESRYEKPVTAAFIFPRSTGNRCSFYKKRR